MLGIFPRDEFTLYEAPVFTYVTSAAGATKQIVDSDPDRVVIILAASNAATGVFTMDPAPAFPVGIPVSNTTGAQILSYEYHGPIVQSAWFFRDTGAGNQPVVAMTVALRRNPKLYGYRDVFKDRILPAVQQYSGRLTRSLLSAGRALLPAGVDKILRERFPGVLGDR